VQEETSKVPEGTVTAELQRGYRLRERVLRPALVAVAKAPSQHSAGNGGSEDQ
jgi:molecular chaperone GrpE